MHPKAAARAGSAAGPSSSERAHNATSLLIRLSSSRGSSHPSVSAARLPQCGRAGAASGERGEHGECGAHGERGGCARLHGVGGEWRAGAGAGAGAGGVGATSLPGSRWRRKKSWRSAWAHVQRCPGSTASSEVSSSIAAESGGRGAKESASRDGSGGRCRRKRRNGSSVVAPLPSPPLRAPPSPPLSRFTGGPSRRANQWRHTRATGCGSPTSCIVQEEP
eukprot:scaffold59704_cov64-Phaeocystis_antarctica.AAC.4